MILLPLRLAMAQPAGEDILAGPRTITKRVEAALAGLSEKDAARIPIPDKRPVL
jgi:hypothetical protein